MGAISAVEVIKAFSAHSNDTIASGQHSLPNCTVGRDVKYSHRTRVKLFV